MAEAHSSSQKELRIGSCGGISRYGVWWNYHLYVFRYDWDQLNVLSMRSLILIFLSYEVCYCYIYSVVPRPKIILNRCYDYCQDVIITAKKSNRFNFRLIHFRLMYLIIYQASWYFATAKVDAKNVFHDTRTSGKDLWKICGTLHNLFSLSHTI